jgi:hypothetical protein
VPILQRNPDGTFNRATDGTMVGHAPGATTRCCCQATQPPGTPCLRPGSAMVVPCCYEITFSGLTGQGCLIGAVWRRLIGLPNLTRIVSYNGGPVLDQQFGEWSAYEPTANKAGVSFENWSGANCTGTRDFVQSGLVVDLTYRNTVSPPIGQGIFVRGLVAQVTGTGNTNGAPFQSFFSAELRVNWPVLNTVVVPNARTCPQQLMWCGGNATVRPIIPSENGPCPCESFNCPASFFIAATGAGQLDGNWETHRNPPNPKYDTTHAGPEIRATIECVGGLFFATLIKLNAGSEVGRIVARQLFPSDLLNWPTYKCPPIGHTAGGSTWQIITNTIGGTPILNITAGQPASIFGGPSGGDAMIDAMGYTLDSARAEAQRGSCCDAPKP